MKIEEYLRWLTIEADSQKLSDSITEAFLKEKKTLSFYVKLVKNFSLKQMLDFVVWLHEKKGAELSGVCWIKKKRKSQGLVDIVLESITQNEFDEDSEWFQIMSERAKEEQRKQNSFFLTLLKLIPHYGSNFTPLKFVAWIIA